MSDQVNEGTTESTETPQGQEPQNAWPDGNFRIPTKGGAEIEVTGRELWDLGCKQKAGHDEFVKAQKLSEEMKSSNALSAEDQRFAGIGRAMVGMKASGIDSDEQIKLGKEAMVGMGYSEHDADEYLNAYAQSAQPEASEKKPADEGGEMNQAIGGIVTALKQVADRLDRIEATQGGLTKEQNTRTKDEIKRDFFAAAEKHEEFGRFAKDTGSLGKRAKQYAWEKLLELAENTTAADYDESRVFGDAIADATAFFKDTAGARSGGENSMPDHLGGFGGAPGVDMFRRDKPIARVSAKDASYADNGALRILQAQAAMGD